MDFAEYVAAHRPTLVRSAVLLGCGVDDAEDLVQTALARCLRSWRRVSATDRPDAYVYTVLVNSFRDSRAGAGPASSRRPTCRSRPSRRQSWRPVSAYGVRSRR